MPMPCTVAMHTKARGFIALGLAFAVASGCQDPRPGAVEIGLHPPVKVAGEELPTWTLDEAMARYGVPGVGVAVVDGGTLAWTRSYGVKDVRTGEPVTDTTLFQAASISKPVAALAALQLVEEGDLTLDDDVGRWLSSWRLPDRVEHPGDVSVRRLVTHTAGLTVHGFPGYARGDALPTTVEVLEGAGNTPPVVVDTAPGALWRYSGGGYTVLQLLLEDVTGRPFPALLRDRVLGPLGMDGSGYMQPLPADRAGRAATGHRSDGTPVVGEYHTYPEMAAAGLWTTPADLARYIVGVQRALEGAEDAVLSPAMAEAMLEPGPGGWGLGPAVTGAGDSLQFSHGGANAGFRAQLVAFPRRGQGAVVMTNSDAGRALAMEVMRSIAMVYGWPDFEVRTITEVPLEPGQAPAFAGEYRIPGQDATVTVTPTNGRLQLQVPGEPHQVYLRTAADTFTSLRTGSRITFERDEEGAVIAVRGRGVRLPRAP